METIWRLHMETIETKCYSCGKTIYIIEEFVRDKMFCTLGCLDKYDKDTNKIIS